MHSIFIFGGLNTMQKLINDNGYYMYTISNNKMEHIQIQPASEQLLLRQFHSINTISVPLTDPKMIELCRLQEMVPNNYVHIVYGGQIEDPVTKQLVCS